MKTVAILNCKGGVGKTTVCYNLITGLADKGNKVLAIDLDPQASLTFCFVQPEFWNSQLKNKFTAKSFFDNSMKEISDKLERMVYAPKINNSFKDRGKLDLVVADFDLIDTESRLAFEIYLSENNMKYFDILANGLKNLIDSYDYVVIDCAANFGMLTRNALVSTDYLLVPSRADYLSTLGIHYMIDRIKKFIKIYNRYQFNQGVEHNKLVVKLIGVLFTMINLNHENVAIEEQKEIIEQIINREIPVFQAFFPESKSVFDNHINNIDKPAVMRKFFTSNGNLIKKQIEAFILELENKIK